MTLRFYDQIYLQMWKNVAKQQMYSHLEWWGMYMYASFLWRLGELF